MERVDIVRAPLFARLLSSLGRKLPALPAPGEPISRLDPEALSEDRLRDLGLLEGRRRRGDPDSFLR